MIIRELFKICDEILKNKFNKLNIKLDDNIYENYDLRYHLIDYIPSILISDEISFNKIVGTEFYIENYKYEFFAKGFLDKEVFLCIKNNYIPIQNIKFSINDNNLLLEIIL